ncbi:hypothetical protein GCM10027578_09720 [Spirosoma luteolum]
MNRSTFLLTLATASALTLSAYTPARPRADERDTPYQTKTFTGTINAVRAETSGGSLTVEGGTGKDARIEVFVRANNGNDRNQLSKAELDERLRDYDISVEKEGSTLVAIAKRRNNNNDWKRSVSISFKVYTPRAVATDLRTSGGSISLSGLSGKQRFKTSGGSLNLTDVQGDIVGQTSGGSINLDRCRQTGSGGQLDLQTSGGSISAKASSGNMRLHTSGGSIELLDLTGDIDAQTSGGSVRGTNLDGDIKAGTSGGSVRLANVAGSVDASTSAGSVDVSLSKLGKYVRLNTSVGSVRVKMPLNQGLTLNLSGNRVQMPERLNGFDGDIEKNRVRGRLNGGGIPVDISASMGSVSIN